MAAKNRGASDSSSSRPSESYDEDYGEIRIKFTDTTKEQDRVYTKFYKDPGPQRKEKIEVKVNFAVAAEET